MYLFPPVSLMGKVVSKLSDHWYRRAILIAPGWPNMPWFWDLVELSARVPLCLPHHPDLVTQPFNKARHRDLTNLNLHAWLLEPRQSRSRGSLAQWHQELRRLKDVQPEQSTKRSEVGRFCQMVRNKSGGLQEPIYKTNSRFPPAPFPGEKSPAQHY